MEARAQGARRPAETTRCSARADIAAVCPNVRVQLLDGGHWRAPRPAWHTGQGLGEPQPGNQHVDRQIRLGACTGAPSLLFALLTLGTLRGLAGRGRGMSCMSLLSRLGSGIRVDACC